MDNDEVEAFKRLFDSLDREFDLRSGFFQSLMEEDDWSFVVKLHALLEAGVSHLLTNSQGDHRLREVFERLPLSDTDVGKLAFVKELSLLNKDQRKFIKGLSEIRNKLVHRVNNVNFVFADHIAAMNKDQQRSFSDTFSAWAEPGKGRDHWAESAIKTPKLTIWYGGLRILLAIRVSVNDTKAQRDRADRLLEIAEDLVANDPDLFPEFDEDQESEE